MLTEITKMGDGIPIESTVIIDSLMLLIANPEFYENQRYHK